MGRYTKKQINLLFILRNALMLIDKKHTRREI